MLGWGLNFSSKLDWVSYIISIAKTASKKIEALIHSCFFLLMLLCISINLPYNHAWSNYCHVWDSACNCGLSLAASPEPLAHCQNVASLSFSYRYNLGRCSSELAQLVPPPYSQWRSTCYSDRLHDFFITIPRCYNNVHVNSFFPCTARLQFSA